MAIIKSKRKQKQKPISSQDQAVCGLVMPISPIDGCSEAHWLEVRSILVDAIETAGFECSLVSDADDIGVIQKRIVQNIYENPMIVCDVSGKNPNVMFELGLRLAFDKPTLIVKDDKTTYSFDTAPIEHLIYPRDLRFAAITQFKADLARRLQATFGKATSDPSYTTFLKHFGTFSVAKLETKEVSREEFLAGEIGSLRDIISELSMRMHAIPRADSERERKSRSGTEVARIMRELRRAILQAVKSRGFKNRDAILESRPAIRLYVERKIDAPKLFEGRYSLGVHSTKCFRLYTMAKMT